MANRATKQAFPPAAKLHLALKREAMERGLICYPMGGTIDGRLGDHVLIAPPFIVNEMHVAEIVDRFSSALAAALATAS
ncbi:hypothetical protein D3C83_67790 [compost metagenome]